MIDADQPPLSPDAGCAEPPARLRRALIEARHAVWNGDLLLFPGRGPISVAGRGKYTHAAMAGWWRHELMCVELREWLGGRAVTLASQLAAHPAGIDVFRPVVTDRDRERALDIMIGKAGKRYGYRQVLAAALLHLPVVRYFVRPDTSRDLAEASQRPEYCSQAVCNAYHAASGRDPVPHLADRLTEPSDLARTTFFAYQFTLAP